MPNGGSDCCGTCWFNAKNKGHAGYGHANDPERDFCSIRDLDIEDPFYTYCANHPHSNPDRLQIPVGPVFTGDPRKVWKPCPDTEDVRRALMQIAATIVEKPRQEYPTGHPLDVFVIWQLGEFAETRAIQELQRIASFDETLESEGPFTRSRKSAVLAAREALKKIEANPQ